MKKEPSWYLLVELTLTKNKLVIFFNSGTGRLNSDMKQAEHRLKLVLGTCIMLHSMYFIGSPYDYMSSLR